MLLLLLWRHLEYYAEPGSMSNPPTRTSITNAMRLLATSSPEQLRQEVATKLGPILQRISSLEIVRGFYHFCGLNKSLTGLISTEPRVSGSRLAVQPGIYRDYVSTSEG